MFCNPAVLLDLLAYTVSHVFVKKKVHIIERTGLDGVNRPWEIVACYNYFVRDAWNLEVLKEERR